MDVRNAHRAWMITCALATAGALTATAEAVAQEPVLPPVIVEGATLEAPAKPTPVKQTTQDTVSANTPASGSSPPSPSVAQEPADAVVDGEGTNAAAATQTAGVEARKLGVPVSVITGADLKARQIRNAADALRSLPGVAVSRAGGAGNLTQVRIRGAEANQTLVIIDGIEANDTSSGEFDFSNLSADDIERIEVIRGGQSGLYGSRAIGGVINIVTRGGKGPLTFRGRAEGGSFGTSDVAGSVSAGNDKGYLAVAYNFQNSGGFNIAPQGSEEDGFDRSTFNLRGGVSIVSGVNLDFSLRNSRTTSDFDDFSGPPLALQTAIDSPNIAEASIWLGGARLTWDTFDGALTHVFGGNFNSTDSSSQSPFFSADNENDRQRFNYLATARFAQPEIGVRHVLSGLVERERETFTPNDSFGPPFGADGVERERNRTAYAAEYRGEFLDRLFPTASVRREDNDTFSDFTTWKTALSVDLKELRLRPHASAGTAVALPGLFEQFGTVVDSFFGNPNLVPEESFGWDAGVEFIVVPGRASVDVTYFESDLENEIVGFGETLINLADRSERRGVEVAATAEVTKGLVLGAAYTWLDASDPTGLAEVRRPEHSARFDANYSFDSGRANFNVAAIYNGTAPDVAFFFDPNPPPFGTFGSTFVDLDSYVLLNVAASYKLSPGVELYGRVENALDDDYQEVFGFETADIAAYAGMRFTYVEEATRAWSEGR